MGHKVHPNAFRLGVIRGWEATWYASHRDYTKLLHEDLEMRRSIMSRLRNAGIAKIETERSSNNQLTVTIHTAKPGIVIGKGGASVDQLREELERRFTGNRIRISIQEIKQPELDAQLVAENIASQIERRINHRRAMKQSILRTMRAGAKGVRVTMGGRLRGGEMARREWDRAGRVPLHTLRADIDFGRAVARTTFGVIGIKCWIYKDLVAPRRRGGGIAEAAEADGDGQVSRPAAEPSAPRGRRRGRRSGGDGGGQQGGGQQGGGGQQRGGQQRGGGAPARERPAPTAEATPEGPPGVPAAPVEQEPEAPPASAEASAAEAAAPEAPPVEATPAEPAAQEASAPEAQEASAPEAPEAAAPEAPEAAAPDAPEAEPTAAEPAAEEASAPEAPQAESETPPANAEESSGPAAGERPAEEDR